MIKAISVTQITFSGRPTLAQRRPMLAQCRPTLAYQKMLSGKLPSNALCDHISQQQAWLSDREGDVDSMHMVADVIETSTIPPLMGTTWS